MKKRILSILLALVMCFTILPVNAAAAGDVLTRAELAELLYNKFHLTPSSGGPTFNDIESCTPAQKTAMKLCICV